MNRILTLLSAAVLSVSALLSGGTQNAVQSEETETAYSYTIQDVRNLQNFLQLTSIS